MNEEVEMKHLQVGQKILIGLDEENNPNYETVYGFAHRDVNKVAEYLRITTNAAGNGTGESNLEISSDHLIFVQGREDPVPAGSLAVGDVLIHQSADKKESATITRIQAIRQRGLYAPLTKDGTMLVDGIHTSSYVSIHNLTPRVIGATMRIMSEQTLFHWWMAPYRLFCTHIGPQMCINDCSEEEGYIYWLVAGRTLAEIAQGSSQFLMVAGLAMVLCFCGVFVLLESVLNQEKSIVWFVLVASCFFLWWQLSSSAKKKHKKVEG